ncbi:hypothetical protein E7T06_13690 [Deinococcus sp. Arct2-2]|uniref:hypothetical protein n=1 Tax=Deinococcus sp. Arct2-2 TaxID=2568653 RepID=UPI0010A4209F|nr:hypothetical protein [Deinococcus sp. Arct2-2]THF69009.1 hypothetical protein E7T06_13690 [Deinococcus sp. Arct2-2]
MSWPQTEIERLTADYGTVPPPWILYPEFHPLSAFWRMGGGEGYMMFWSQWWQKQTWDEAQQFAYFQSFSPPPHWVPWTGDVIWGYDDETEEDAVLERLEGLGLGSRAEVLADWEDER